MIGSNTTSNGIYENSFASLLFPDKPPVKKKRPHSKKPESSTKAVPPPSIIPKKPEIKPTNNNVSYPQPHQHKTNPQHHHQSQSNHHKTHSNTIAKNIAPVTKKKESNSLLDKLKNFDSLEALENEIEKNKHDVKKLFPDETKITITKIEKKPMQKDRDVIPKKKIVNNEPKKVNQVQPKKQSKDQFLNKKRQISQEPSNSIPKKIPNKINSSSIPNKDINKKPLPQKINCEKCKCFHLPNMHVRPSEIKKSSTQPLNVQKPIHNTKPITSSSIKKPSKPIPQNPQMTRKKPKYNPNNPFSRHPEDEDFIVDEDDDDLSYEKEMAIINHKLMRGRQIINDGGDDLEEANFDTIQKEERVTQVIAEYEDKLEELKEQERKKKKKS